MSGMFGEAFVHERIMGRISQSETASSLFVTGVGVVTTFFCGPCSIGFTAAAQSELTYFQTGDVYAGLRAGARTAASAAVFYGIGRAFNNTDGFFRTNSAQHIGAHALAGGVMAELQGGKFGHGFFSAGITKFATAQGYIDGGIIEGGIKAGILGGTVSAMTGGKFGNGAMTGAFSYVLNKGLSDARERRQSTMRYRFALNKEIQAIGSLSPDDYARLMGLVADYPIRLDGVVKGSSLWEAAVSQKQLVQQMTAILASDLANYVESKLIDVPQLDTGNKRLEPPPVFKILDRVTGWLNFASEFSDTGGYTADYTCSGTKCSFNGFEFTD